MWLKRLEKGTFSWPAASGTGQKKLKLAPEALALLLDGVDMRDGKFKPCYERD
jgi:hypothetical protein